MPLDYPPYRYPGKSCNCGYRCKEKECEKFVSIVKNTKDRLNGIDDADGVEEKSYAGRRLFDYLIENWGYYNGYEVFQYTVWKKLNGDDLIKGICREDLDEYKKKLFVVD